LQIAKKTATTTENGRILRRFLHFFFQKETREKDEVSNDFHPRHENGHEKKTATGSAEFVADPVDEVEVSATQ
jgi:hypothetical protein